jgi:hypothetical protein
LEKKGNPSAEEYRRSLALSAEIKAETERMNAYRPLFDEPYFARMDLVDNKEGYNSYYIGKKGDVKLEIVDWRAPVSRRYYQKSCASFTFNEYEYKAILRRALRTKNGKVEDFKNEYLSLKDYLTEEEIGGKDEENVLDPFLREIIKKRKEEASVKDIIRTIQEKQYEIITCDEEATLLKTMAQYEERVLTAIRDYEPSVITRFILDVAVAFNKFYHECRIVNETDEKVRATRIRLTEAANYVLGSAFSLICLKKTEKV